MAEAPLILRKRTIQHPGFEFFETDLSIYKEYQMDTDALVVMFASKGPIMEAVALTNMSDYKTYFGTPESEAEIYFYKGIEKVIGAGGTVTAIRLPYFNDTFATYSSDEGVIPLYKAIVGNFVKSSLTVPDILNSYTGTGPTFINIKTSVKKYTRNSLVNIIGGVSDEEDFAIINKYNDIKTERGVEYFVSILGAGNAVRAQGLNSLNVADSDESDKLSAYSGEIKLFAEKNGISSFDISDPYKFTVGRKSDLWASSGKLNEQGDILTVADAFEEKLIKYFPTILTKTITETKEIKGKPSITATFTLTPPESGEYYLSDMVYDTDPAGLFINYTYGTTTADEPAIDVSEDLKNKAKYPDTATTFGAAFKIESLGAYGKYKICFDYNGDGAFHGPAPIDGDYELTLEKYNGEPKGIDSTGKFVDPVTLSFTIPATKSVEAGKEKTVINPTKDDFITVVVSKVKPSVLESGKFDIEIVEAFNGSLFKNSVDIISQESNYIGDIINSNSAYIAFYSKDAEAMEAEIAAVIGKSQKTADPAEYTFLVSEQEPYDISWVSGGSFETINPEAGMKVSLAKNIYKPTDLGGDSFANYSKDVLTPTLDRVKNSIKYTFRDVYNFGLSTIISSTKPDSEATALYNPTKTVMTIMEDDIKIPTWKAVANTFSQFCQYKHKLSMFHNDGPRKVVLNGNLSRIDELYEDYFNKIFTSKIVQRMAIKDNTYIETNVQWYEAYDEFNMTKIWLPSSIFLAGNITRNDIASNVWDAPAGHRYGVVSGVYRPAFNPEEDLQDRLYLNCLNYGVAWPTGVITIEGQKTGYAETSALNRVNVRRLMIWMERYAQNTSAAYIYEPNNQITRDNLKADLDLEYNRIKTLGGVEDVEVVCNEENNPPQVRDANELRFVVKVIPTRTVEFIIGNFIITKSGADLSEISNVF